MSDRTGTFYAADGAIIGYGAQVLIGNGASPEVFTAVAGVKKVKMPETMFADTDFTHLRSPNRHKEHGAGIRDSSEMEVEGIYIFGDTSLTADGVGSGTTAFASGGMPTLAEDGQNRNIIVRFADDDTSEVAITGYIKGFSLTDVGTTEPVGYKFAVMPAQAITLP